VNLDDERVYCSVSIARKNFLGAFHGFINVNLDGLMALRFVQKLTSLGSRYVKIRRVMRPFFGALNRLIAGHATFSSSPQAKIAVKYWQPMFCLAR
jgi:hypothetical protein